MGLILLLDCFILEKFFWNRIKSDTGKFDLKKATVLILTKKNGIRQTVAVTSGKSKTLQ